MISRARGLTLIELIMTITMLAVGFGVLFSTLKITINFWDEGLTSVSETDRLNTAYATLYDDIKYADTVIRVENNPFLLLISTHPNHKRTSESVTVSYTLSPDDQAISSLIRSTRTSVDLIQNKTGQVVLRNVATYETHIEQHPNQLIQCNITLVAPKTRIQNEWLIKPIRTRKTEP